jgi:hypothetical protein
VALAETGKSVNHNVLQINSFLVHGTGRMKTRTIGEGNRWIRRRRRDEVRRDGERHGEK